MGQLPTAMPEPDFPRPGSRICSLSQSSSLCFTHLQGPSSLRAFARAGPPAWSAPSQLLLLPLSQFGWHPGCPTPPHPPASALQHVTVRFPRGRDCHSERSGPRFVLSIIICFPPVKARTWPLQPTAGFPHAGGQPGLHMARFPLQVCPPHRSRDLGGLLGSKPRKGKRLYRGRAGPMLHFLCEVTVSPAPGTAITSLDCSRIPLPTVQKAPSCYPEMAQEGLR